MRAGHKIGNLAVAGILLLGAAALAATFLVARSAAAAEQVLYRFCQQDNCTDGSGPVAPLILDPAGNLYGTTELGGNSAVCPDGCGTVFKLAADGTETVLYAFCPQPGCADGSNPAAGLLLDAAGNLYGTTYAGGTGNGVVFKLAPDGTETVLYSFCQQSGCADGASPQAGLIADGAGNLYSMTVQGGAAGRGVVFELSPDPTGTVWTETVLYSFCQQSGCADGSGPAGSLTMDAGANLYGTTYRGGAGNAGVVFKLVPGGTETVLYSFCQQSGCSDGSGPEARVIMDGAGNLYGTTFDGNGSVFELTPDPTGTVYTETVLYRFCSQSGCADGSGPEAGLIMDAAGNLYGTTSGGGIGASPGNGVAFELTPDPTGTVWTETVLYRFCAQAGCADGSGPGARLTMDAAGNLYGTTANGGDSDSGVAFALTP